MPRPVKERKIALLGYRSVGKSSLAIQYVENHFPENYDPTIEQIYTKSCNIKGQEYYLRILDTSGQDEYSIFSPNYAIDVHGYCLVYSINSAHSFDVIKVIYEKLMDAAGGVKVPLVLVGNKTDLSTERVISADEGRRLAEEWGAQFIELSARQNKRVLDLFENLLTSIERVNQPHIEPKESKCSLM